MKKLMFALVAAGAAAVMAEGEIESANVVGYSTVTFAAGDRYVICGIPFDNTADPEGLSIQDLVPDPLNNGWTGGSSANNADAIQFWANGKYVTLHLFNTTATTSAALARKGKWINPGASMLPDASWGTGSQPSALKLKPGMSFWIRRAPGTETEAKTLTLSGQVVTSSANATHTVVEGYNLFTSGYTGGFPLNNGYIDWMQLGAVGGSSANNADSIQFWANGKYVTLYLFNSTATTTAALARKGKWINPGASMLPDASWGTGSQPSTKVVQPGEGFWYRHRGSGFSFTETKPYDL